MRVDFYHMQLSSVEQVLPKLLEKAYATGKRVLVKVGNEARVDFLNTALWTYEDESFLPHGTKKDGNAALQPIWLTSGDDNPNQAEMLFLVDDAKIAIDSLSQFARVLNLFDGSDPDSLSQARDFWRQVKNSGNECVYWQQDNNGSWHQQS